MRALAAAALGAALGLAPSAAAQSGAAHVDRERGFELSAPRGWVVTPQPQPDGSHTTWLLPPASGGRVLLGVNVRALGPGEGEDELVARSLALVAADTAFGDLERFEAELAGAVRPALRVTYESPAGPLTLEVGYCAAGERGYVLQRAAPPDEFERWRDDFALALASFRTLEVAEPDAQAALVRALAARCGSEVAFAPDWDTAARRARELGRPILVVAWAYGGFDLPVRPESSLLCDPDLVELLATRFVVWKLDPRERNDFAASYGLSPTTFGQALIVADAEGATLAQVDDAADADRAYAFLRGVLARHGGAPLPLSDAPSELARGELERAFTVLADDESAHAALLRARALRLSRRGVQALEQLERVAPDDEFAPAALAERMQVQLGLGRADEARASALALAVRHAAAPEAAAAALVLGLLDVATGAPEAARERWLALCASHPDSPWTWQAADALDSGLLDSGLLAGADLAWPDDAELAEALDARPWAPLPVGEAAAARDGALAWLLAQQRADGSWPGAVAARESRDGRPSPFVDAVTALATRALLAHRGSERVDAALARAYAFLLTSVAARERTSERASYMDYTPWSDAALLDACASALDARVGDADALRAAASALVADLARRRQPHGGWGYYVTGDLAGSAAPPTSMSFTTAAVVLALAGARAQGCAVEESALADAATALESMRSAEGHFVYLQGPGGEPRVSARELPGAAGRAPACELALARAGRSTSERLRRALEVFLADAPSLAAERGKALMHCGAQGQGSHYILFDYAWAAATAAELPPDGETRVRLTQLVLDCRRDDGSFLDTPVNGPAYGTAQALLALDALSR
jgi:hypothetical protein